MRNFDRITTDPNVANGLPCIRDTGIIVGEVVKVIQGGKSAQEMRAIYFELDDEDLFQAQGYAIKNLVNEIANWRHEGLMPISTIRGYSELLANEERFPHVHLTEAEKQFSQKAIFQSSILAMSIWNHFSLWARLYYDENRLTWDDFTIQELTSEIENDLFYKEYSSKLTVIPNQNISTVRLTYQLLVIIAFFVHHFDYNLNQEAVISFEVLGNKIGIKVSRKTTSEHYRSLWLLESASQIVKFHNSEFDLVQTTDNVTFILRISQPSISPG